MKNKTILFSLLVVLCALLVGRVFGAEDPASSGGHALNPLALLGVAVILLVGKLGGELFERLSQPAVLGELVGGIFLGNLVILGVYWAEPLKREPTIAALAEIGVIILLFEVGLESDLKEMMEVGWSSLLVATLGVVAPFFLGWAVSAYFLPDEATLGHIFIGATLCATSVGITARVFKDLGKLNTREARIILGAAVIDDVMGLLILAVVSGAIRSAANGTTLSMIEIGFITVKAVLFLVGATVIGHFLVPHLLRGAGRLETRGVLLTLAISICLCIAVGYLASWFFPAPDPKSLVGLTIFERHP